MENLYETLGVNRTATLEEIKKAFKDKAKKLHPDKPGGDKAKFQEIQRAYEVLSDAGRRDRYDKTGEVEERDERQEMVHFMMAHMFVTAVSKAGSEEYKEKDIIKKAKGIAFEAITQCRKEIAKWDDQIKIKTDLVQRLSTKKGTDNVISAQLLVSMEMDKAAKEEIEYRMGVIKEVHDSFDNYHYKADPPKPRKEPTMSGPSGGIFAMMMEDILKSNPDFEDFLRKHRP